MIYNTGYIIKQTTAHDSLGFFSFSEAKDLGEIPTPSGALLVIQGP